MTRLMIAILVLGVGGLLFSGFLTYQELFAAEPAAVCTPVGAPGTILGAPPCVYGFFMYLAIVVMATVGLMRKRRA